MPILNLMRAYGMLAFCCELPTPREYIHRDELLELYPTLTTCTNKAVSFYLEEARSASGEPFDRLGVCFIAQERRQEDEANRLWRKIHDISAALGRSQDARDINQQSGFGLALVVARDSTKREVLSRLNRGRRLPSRLTIEVVEGLEQFYPLLGKKETLARDSKRLA